MTLRRHPIARSLALLALALSALAPLTAVSQEAASRAAPGAGVIAVVDGIPIRQFEWDRLAPAYFKEVEAEAGRALSEEELRLLRHNVLHELIRERLWIADAKRRGLSVTPAQVEARMRQSDFFKTDGKPDESKFQAYKRSPTSNYPTVRTQLELGMILEQYQRWMERRFGPRDAELRQAFRERTVQASLRYFLLGPDAVSLEPEATEAQIRAYYEAHPDEFRAAAEARIQFVKVPFPGAPASSDSARDVAAVAGLEKAKELLVAIRSGIPPETAAKVYGGFHDSGPFRLGEPIRGLGRSDALADAIRAGDVGAWLPEPVRVGTNHVVARVLEKKSSRLVSLREAAAAAKRKADAEVRDAFVDSLARAEIDRHPESYLRPLVLVTVVARPLAAYDDPKPIAPKDVEKSLRRLRKEAGIADTARAWIDSVRTALPARLGAERRLAAGSKAMREILRELEKGKAAAEVAGRRNATVSLTELYRGQPPAQPGLAEGAFLDSLYDRRPGSVVGPRVTRDTIFVARVERVDPAFRPPYETVRAEARTAALLARRQETEREAERWFRDRRERYMTPVRFVLDAAYLPKQPLDTLAVPEDSVAAYHASHPLEFTEVARARVRHLLVGAAPSDPARVKDAARQKALDLRERIVKGADFAAIAKEHSDDKTSAERGGDLGTMIRSQVAAEFGAVAFSIPVGQVSEPVLTRFGYHLILVEEREPERLRALDECRSEIREVLAGAYGDSAAVRRARTLIAAARDSASFAEAAAIAEGGVRRFGPMAAGESLGEFGPQPGLAEWVGSLPVGAITQEPLRLTTGYLVARKAREAEPVPAAFEEVRERVVADYQQARRETIAGERNRDVRARLAAGADLDSTFIVHGGLRPSKAFGRSGPIPDFARDPSIGRDSVYLETVFASKPGATLPPLEGSIGTLYAKVESLTDPSPTEYAKRRDELRRELLEQRTEAWTERLRARATVAIHRADLKGLER